MNTYIAYTYRICGMCSRRFDRNDVSWLSSINLQLLVRILHSQFTTQLPHCIIITTYKLSKLPSPSKALPLMVDSGVRRIYLYVCTYVCSYRMEVKVFKFQPNKTKTLNTHKCCKDERPLSRPGPKLVSGLPSRVL